METQDGNQWNKPETSPKGPHKAPHLPDGEEKDSVRKGAQESDQLDKLKPADEDEKAPGEIGSPPLKEINKGEE